MPVERPDVLVLGAGGTLGEAWLQGMLAGIEEHSDLDFRRTEHFVGTSAGSIVAATLAAGRRPRRADAAGAELGEAAPETPDAGNGSPPGRRALPVLARAARLGLAAAAPAARYALAAAAPAGRVARAAALARTPPPYSSLDGLRPHIDSLGARFDGRLRIAAVDKVSGRRVMFGAPRAPRASVTDAVVASCAVPWLFAPVSIGDRLYVDGGVWSPTNLDAAPARRGTVVLCLVPTGARPASFRSFYGALKAASRAAVGLEAAALRRRGAQVRIVVPDAGAAAAMGEDFMDPRRRAAVAAAARRQGRALAEA